MEKLVKNENGQWVLETEELAKAEHIKLQDAKMKAMENMSNQGKIKGSHGSAIDMNPAPVIKPTAIPGERYKEDAAVVPFGKEEEEAFKAEELKMSANGQWSLEKAEMGRGGKPKDISMFTADHMNAVVKMPHPEAKAHAHAAVDASAARPDNKVKAKKMIDSSKSSKHLAMGMGNFLLASEGLASTPKG